MLLQVGLYPTLRHIDRILARWAHRKFKSLRRLEAGSMVRASRPVVPAPGGEIPSGDSPGDRVPERRRRKEPVGGTQERLSQFGLAIHEGKTRLIAFGRHIARQRELAGARQPETFDILGFTQLLRQDQKPFTVKRKLKPNAWSAS